MVVGVGRRDIGYAYIGAVLSRCAMRCDKLREVYLRVNAVASREEVRSGPKERAKGLVV